MTPAELTTRRESLDLSKAQLARALKVEWLTIHRWERGVHPVPKWVEAFLIHLPKGAVK
jgi:DNA-binding transcriptional regulator YiaG